MLVKEIMTKEAVFAYPEDPIQKVATLLSNNGYHGIPIVRKDSMILVGIITETDFFTREGLAFYLAPYLEKMKDKGTARPEKESSDFNNMTEAIAKDIMKIEPITVDPDADIEELTKIFTEKKVHTVPVVKNEKLVGVVSMADMVKLIHK